MAKIVLDPGHSGPIEPGAVGLMRTTEASVVLLVAISAASFLRADGHEVILTREGDIQNDGLSFRADIANDTNADVFVSIHANAADNRNATGTETYHYPGSSLGRKLAGFIQEELVYALELADRGVKEADHAVTRLTNMPACLTELAFISNPREEQLLNSPHGQVTCGMAIYKGVHRYLNS